MLQGLVKCSACGGTLSFTGAGMNCVRYVHGKCKMSHYITVKKLEELALGSMEDQMSGLKLFQNSRPLFDREAELLIPEQLLRREEAVLGRYKEAYAAGVDSLEEYREHKAASSKRTQEVLKALEKLKRPAGAGPAAFSEKHREVSRALKEGELTDQEKNLLLRGFVDHMVFYRAMKKVEVVYYV